MGGAALNPVSVREVLACLGPDVLAVQGGATESVDRPLAINADACEDGISFCSSSGPAGMATVRDSGVPVIVCTPDVADALAGELSDAKVLIAVENPRLSFARILSRLFAPSHPAGVHATATIEPDVRIGKRVYIGPYAYVAAESVGDDTVIHGHVHIYPGARIGSHVTIHAGAVIGADGFGYECNDRGEWEKFIHFGDVVIEDNVDIGANACIDRGALGSTVIRRGAKIDNLVYIAHNVCVGERALVIASSVILGSAELGAGCWIAPSATIRDKTKVGRGAKVGLGAVVTRDVADGELVMGVPARPFDR